MERRAYGCENRNLVICGEEIGKREQNRREERNKLKKIMINKEGWLSILDDCLIVTFSVR